MADTSLKRYLSFGFCRLAEQNYQISTLPAKIPELICMHIEDNLIEQLYAFRLKMKGIIYGNLVKFEGDQADNINHHRHKEKFVVYVPQKRLLFYSKDDNPNNATTVISVKHIETNTVAEEYRGKCFHIVGHTRVVVFASKEQQVTDLWTRVITTSLNIDLQLIEPYLTLKDQYYIDGWLHKLQGSKKDNIKFEKETSQKYVIFVPKLKILYFCGEEKQRVKTTLVKVEKITRKNQWVEHYMPVEHKDKWFKVIGQDRIVVFVCESKKERNIWFQYILKELSLHKN